MDGRWSSRGLGEIRGESGIEEVKDLAISMDFNGI